MGREIYSNHYEYIEDELKKLDLLLKLAIHRNKKTGRADDGVFPGLAVNREYVETLLESGESREGVDLQALRNEIHNKNQSIQERYAASLKEGKCLAIDHLRRSFRLDDLEFQILLIALAPLLDARYGKIYSFLQDNILMDSPSMHTIFCIVGGTLEDVAVIRRCFSERSPLVFWGLIKWVDGSSRLGANRKFCIDSIIADFILESLTPAEFSGVALKLLPPMTGQKADFLNRETRQKVERLVELFRGEVLDDLPLVYFQGEGYRDKEIAARIFAGDFEMPLFVVDAARFSSGEEGAYEIRNMFRNALLLRGALFFTSIAGAPELTAVLKDIELFMGYQSGVVIFDLPQSENRDISLENLNHIGIDFTLPGFELRKKLWETRVNGYRIENRENLFEELSDRFSFTSEQIENAVTYARNRSFLSRKNEDDYEISYEDLIEACRRQSTHKLSELGARVEKSYTLKDIILPGEQMDVLGEILSHYRYIRKVFHQWDFGSKVRYGRGISVLFAGDSGTGKTMAASILGAELDLEVYRIDLSSVVSKYIGETEKNLAKIFHEAERSGAVLFFDEADALFGKRTEVKDAHDRYANIEVSYLLQRMEDYGGITILASNLKQNMDTAFTRRLRFVVDFPFPDKTYRLKIWKSIFPKKAPLSKDVDFDFLAEKLELAGGHIKNIALAAGFLASAEGDEINMSHLMRATRREYQKLTRSFLKTEMDPYYDLAMQNKKTRSMSCP